MCGIYGITTHDSNFIQEYINKCSHRGPDGFKVWWHPEYEMTLGHNLLSIMANPKLSIQPWKTPKGNTLIYNGEIFNYNELTTQYKGKGFAGITGCDTELLAWGLDEFGLDFIDKIDSMHGFAYYKHNEQELWLSRDHAGIKPLYYAKIEQGIVFGSEIKGMLDKVPGSRSIDKLAASFQSRTGINPLRNTLFSGVKKLLPGETIIWDIKNKKIKQTKRIYIKPNSNISFNPQEFRDQLKSAVKRCSIGQRKIGVFLSGGLDSSVVAYELGKIKGEVNSFTNKFSPSVQADEDYNSDAKAAKILAEAEGFNHTEVEITPKSFIENWNDSIYYMEQPVYNPSMAMYCYTNKVLSKNGIVVTMAGDMGDEILGGYPKYQKMYNGQQPTSWDDVLRMWFRRLKRPTKIIQDVIDDEILINEFSKCYSNELWNPKDPVASYMALDCVTQVPAEFFSRNDKYGMAFSMEGRFPLASKFFMQYCLNIHTKFKIGKNENETKLLSKQAYKDLLPNEIITKEKTGWTVPIGHWLTNNLDSNLNKFYRSAMGNEVLDNLTHSQKSGKTLIPSWIVKDWKNRYEVTNA